MLGNNNRKRGNFFDITGEVTGVGFQKKMVIVPVISAMLMLIGAKLPLTGYGENTGLALGFFLSVILCFVVRPWDMLITCMMVPAGGFFLGFWDWKVIQSATGASTFVSMFALTLVSAGADTTPIGKRVTLLLLKKFHGNPVRLVLVIGVAACLISGFVSNIATCLLVSSIVNQMLLAMGEKPGKSKLGCVLMVLIATVPYIGGVMLVSGSAATNLLGINLLESATNGAYTITYAQWAAVGIPAVLITIVPVCLMYIRMMGLKISDVKNTTLSDQYYQKLYDELGPMQASEIRWMIITLGMVVWMMAGGHATVVPLLAAILSLMPLVGVVPVDQMFRLIPMKILFMIFFMVSLGQLFTQTGLSTFFTALLAPVFGGLNPYLFSVSICLALVFLENVCVTVNSPYILVMSLSVPLCISAGYNPSVMLLPVIMSASFVFVLRYNTFMLVNKNYGWWETKDGILPSIITAVILCLLIPLLSVVISPMLGISVYI